MIVDDFTLTGIAFPIAPANLDGFTIDGFQWMGGPEPDQPDPDPTNPLSLWEVPTRTCTWETGT